VGAALRILMNRHGIGVEDAFELLVRAARRSRVELPDVAVGVVRAGRRTDHGGPRSGRPDRARPTPGRRTGRCPSRLI